MKPLIAAALSVLVLAAAGVRAQSSDPESQRIFRTYSDRVVQIRLVEEGSGAKSSIGSGFAVSADGHVVTNYHVIAPLIHHPDRYRAELEDGEGSTHALSVLLFDVVHDLALVKREAPFDEQLAIGSGELAQGARLYSLGNPYDLGLSIVEGTYNGLLEHSRYQRIHFTGSLNPGMSGGPALRSDGAVMGVNVATAGDQLSFLVPAERVRDLLEIGLADDFVPAEDFTAELRRQLHAYQAEYIAELLDQEFESAELGDYSVPSRPADHFSCWGNALHGEEDLYRAWVHSCSAGDRVYVSEEHNYSLVRLRHHTIESDELSRPRFYALYTQFFEGNHSDLWGHETDVSEFRCRTRFVEQNDLVFKALVCARSYRKLSGLYDVVFKAASLGKPNRGLETALVMSGVSFENAIALARRHLEAITWNQ